MEGRILKHWQSAVIIANYKGNAYKMECKNFKGISHLSMPAKWRVCEMAKGLIGEEHCGFRVWRGCVDQVFVIMHKSEKCITEGKSLFVVYIDLE